MSSDLDRDLREMFLRHQTDLVGRGTAPRDIVSRVRRRQTRTAFTGIVAALGLALVVLLLAATLGSFDGTQTSIVPGEAGAGRPAETGPSVSEPSSGGMPATDALHEPWLVTQKDIAVGESFMGAWVDGDGEAASAMFSAEGTFDGLQPGILPALHDWFRAGGWTFGTGGCGTYSDSGDEIGYVGCDFTYENDLTRALGMGPVGGTLAFFIDRGKIEAAALQVVEWHGNNRDYGYSDATDNMFRSPDPARQDLFGSVWDMFIEWISTSHPEDFGHMYDAGRGYPILDAQSIESWGRYTDEFVASPEALHESVAEWIANQSFDVQARRVCMSATNEFRATKAADDLRGAAVYSTLAKISERTLAELRALPLATEADRATMDAFVPLAERLIGLYRQQAQAAAAGDHKRLNELGNEVLYLRRDLTLTIWECPVGGFPG